MIFHVNARNPRYCYLLSLCYIPSVFAPIIDNLFDLVSVRLYCYFFFLATGSQVAHSDLDPIWILEILFLLLSFKKCWDYKSSKLPQLLGVTASPLTLPFFFLYLSWITHFILFCLAIDHNSFFINQWKQHTFTEHRKIIHSSCAYPTLWLGGLDNTHLTKGSSGHMVRWWPLSNVQFLPVTGINIMCSHAWPYLVLKMVLWAPETDTSNDFKR